MRIETGENGEVLKMRVLRVSREVNGFRIKEAEEKDTQRLLHFDFLDTGDGFAIEIIHSGSRKDLSIEGTVMGMPDGLKDCGRFNLFYDRTNRKLPFPFRYKRLPFIIMLLFGLGMAAFGFLKPQLIDIFPSLAEAKEPEDPRKIQWVLVIGGLLYAAMPALLFWLRRKRFPSDLDVSEDEKEEGEQDGVVNDEAAPCRD
ncbi:hypothetical protein QEH52_19885 [Coraliomargarita sp. SDUM461003]|uniref:Uncharacterized protein n=1 Tax=Thalassobacterium maritimum TaxID=3041265 RepID=A0ABU1B052_9BACT|nr:hypothetical protein [Coraliomargarita sp. SDUM461003]MDQ8209790.1 hypothetical protein [Coraliomargarita sp. SDUM461003]